MNCPRCETRNLAELDRDGVTIDRCDHCRGIWLDRGELEKLLAHARNDSGDSDRDDRDEWDDRDQPRERRRRSIWDIFD